MFENLHTTLTPYVLQTLAEQGAVVYTCDAKHFPNAVLLPLAAHSRHYRMLKAQIRIGKILQKQLWQSIVRAKLDNQAKCLGLAGLNEGRKYIEKLREDVRSGDRQNMEARAAAYYFKQLFGSSFTRSDETIINAMLNYGYAIIRGLIGRSIVCHGFEPSLGIFHKNELNAFNLADDLIEPFRPLVDLSVFRFLQSRKEEDIVFDKEIKRSLFKIISYDMIVNGEQHIISNAIDLCVESYARSITKNTNSLLLPILIEPREHSYG